MAIDSVIVVPSSMVSAGAWAMPARPTYSGVRCAPASRSTSTISMSSIPFSAMNQRTRRGFGARRLS